VGDSYGIATALTNLGIILRFEGDHAAAQSAHEQALSIRRQIGDKQGIGVSLNNIGLNAAARGDYAAARAAYEQSLTIHQELEDQRGIAHVLSDLARLAYVQGEPTGEREMALESLAIWHHLGEKRSAAECFCLLAALTLRWPQGDSRLQPHREKRTGFEWATVLLGAADDLLQATASHLSPEVATEYTSLIELTRRSLDKHHWEQAWVRGRAMSFDEAVAFAHSFPSAA
jgi:tetratricopeptide (TPR) repeat protein